MSLDVSPDGKTIVFDLLGHLYTMPIEGGQAKAITKGLSFNGQPRYSPDGKRIVYTSDRSGSDNVWVIDADGSHAAQLSDEANASFTSPVWTADGKSVLVSKKKPRFYGGAFELWQYSLNGGAGLQIIKSKPSEQAPAEQWHNTLGVTTSPLNPYLYYATRSGTWAAEKLPSWQVARRNTRTGEEQVLTSAQGSAFRPQLSPDGKLLVYGTRFDAQTGLRIRDLTTLEDRWLKFPVQHDDQEGSMSTRDLLPGFAFLPDGKEIVVSYGGKFHRVAVPSGEERPIPFWASVERALGPRLDFPYRVETGPVRARLIQGAAASPEGKHLAFSALRHLYVMDLEPESKPRRVINANEGEFQPAWSPDGAWLAYVTWENEQGAIWKVRADGTDAQRLTPNPARYSQPAWSPDGSRIVALRTSDYQAETQFDQWGHDMDIADLVWIPAAGGASNEIAPAVGFSGVHFTDDPERIFYTLKKSSGPLAAEYQLQSMRWDGTDRRPLFTLKGKDIWGAEISPSVRIFLSPDARTALALYRGQIYVVDAPGSAGEPITIDLSAPPLGVARLTDVGADEVRWGEGGKQITWSLGASFFMLPLSDAGLQGRETAATPAEHVKTTASTQWPHRIKPRETKVVIEAPRYVAQGTIILRGARVITMRGDEVLEAGDVVVKDGRIAYVGRHAPPDEERGARVINVAGNTIVPGFTDTHAHWVQVRRDVLDTENWDFLATLAYGITAGRDPQTFTNDMFVYQDLADTGEIIGPRAYSTGPGIFFVNDFQSADEAADVISRYKDYYRTRLIKSYVVGDRRQREFTVEASNRLQMMPTTEGFADLALDLTHVIDGFSGAEHQFPIFPLYKDVIELVAQSKVFYTPTYIIDYGGPGSENYYFETTQVHNDPKLRRFIPHSFLDSRTSRMLWYRPDEYTYTQAAASAAAITRAGGNVCVGGHGELQGISFHWEMWSMRDGGMTNHEALRSGTLKGAEAIGLAQDLGSIEIGKLADLVILSKNPLEDIHNSTSTRWVMKGGELFDGDTLDEVWPEKKKLRTFWWASDHP